MLLRVLAFNSSHASLFSRAAERCEAPGSTAATRNVSADIQHHTRSHRDRWASYASLSCVTGAAPLSLTSMRAVHTLGAAGASMPHTLGSLPTALSPAAGPASRPAAILSQLSQPQQQLRRYA